VSIDDQGSSPVALLFRERTHLAWTRTALALVIAGALLVRLGYETGTPAVGWAVGGLDALLAGLLWLREDRMPERRDRPSPRVLYLIALATLVTAVAGSALALTI
jgi:uncharacterized membrane protein YidH (DUF202 family)